MNCSYLSVSLWFMIYFHFQICLKKTSKVWKFFIEDVNDPTKAICQVSGCGFRASRGKSGGGLGHLTTSGMMSHLKNKHPKQHQEVLKMNTDVRTADSQKRLLEEEADEMENTQKAHLRTEAEREEFGSFCLNHSF